MKQKIYTAEEIKEHKKIYQRKWREINQHKNLEVERKRDEKRRYVNLKRIEWQKKYIKAYSKKYNQLISVKIKNKIRRQTYYLYGKTPRGFHRHHLDYNSPHNFILLTINEHGKTRRKL